MSWLLVLAAVFLMGCSPSPSPAEKAANAAIWSWHQDAPDVARQQAAQAVRAPAALRAALLAAEGDWHLRHDATETALQRYSDALALDSHSPAAYAGLGDAALVRGEQQAAKEHYLKALEFAPGFAPAHAGLGMIALINGDTGAAREALIQAIASSAEGYEPGMIQAFGALAQQDPAAAQVFDEWLAEHLQQHQDDIRGHVLAGRYYHSQGDVTNALECFQWAYRSRPDFPGLRSELGEALFQARRFGEAAALFETLWKENPSADNLFTLAAIVANMPDYDRATELFTRGMAEHPADQRFVRGLGQVQHQQGEYDAAYATLRPLAEVEAPPFEVLRELGLIEIARQRWADAEAWLQQAHFLMPAEAWVNFALAYLRARAGDESGFEQHMLQVFEQGYVTLGSLKSFDYFDDLMLIPFAAAWIEQHRVVSQRE